MSGALLPEKHPSSPRAPAQASAYPVFDPAATRTLIDDLLAEQQTLQTPVARFSKAHDRKATTRVAARYRDLIPLSAPDAGEQYAFEVELDACTGCKACVAGCHSLNGLDEEETWRDIGLIHGGTPEHPFQQTVTSACHHCADPACLNGCPVLAYEKDPLTGIVRHLDDQCIGCQYCVLKCPYDVPKYNERLGIVRKCDMCHSRLSAGEAPACVQACPTEAIRIVTVITSEVAASAARDEGFLPTAAAPSYTIPTTRYVTARAVPANIAAADATAVRPQPAHWPLVFMLVFTQLGTGVLSANFITGLATQSDRAATLLGVVLLVAGVIASVAHLGQPLRAWRVFLNLRKSWLSREAVVFGLALATVVPFSILTFSAGPAHVRLTAWLGEATAALCVLGVFCSVMIYADTRREFWRLSVTAPKFLGSTLLGALAFSAPIASAGLLAAKVAWELLALRRNENVDTAAFSNRTARLLAGPLAGTVMLRVLCAVVAIPLLATAHVWLGFLSLAAGEVLERSLFFRAVVAPKMPGTVTG